jgi:hypothetical protein
LESIRAIPARREASRQRWVGGWGEGELLEKAKRGSELTEGGLLLRIGDLGGDGVSDRSGGSDRRGEERRG